MDKEGLFANDGSFMERFKQMQQEKEKAAASSAPKPANPKQGFAVAPNKRPFSFELKKAGQVATGGKLAFSLKKAKVAVAPVFAADDEDEDTADVEKEEPAKRHKAVQAETPVAAAPAGAVDYKYYEFQLAKEEKALAQSKEAEASKNGDPNTSAPSDPVALMEFYAKKAAQEERKRPLRQSKDEMPPPPSLQGPPKKGHHMGDFIPPEELEKFMARCEGLGSERRGRADPIMAGDVKKDNLGVGAVKPGEVTSEDDIYEQYKKRMMLGYRHRPNPLNNPRKAYY
nr:unnamed protein product [Digitaria exilis]